MSSSRLISADMRAALLVAVGVAIPAAAALLSLSEAAQVAGASGVVYDGSDTLPAGSPDMGAMLQDAIQGKELAGLLGTFDSGVKSAWADEK